MESFTIENLSFTYPMAQQKALDSVSLTIESGAFVVLCGRSGCGKTTLLKMLKPSLTPHGAAEGTVCFNGRPLAAYGAREMAAQIGFVMQNPDHQLVTDTVWHELAFGLESLGFSSPEIRARVAEMASFFGIQNRFYQKVNELSGGQKQILNLAAVMVMQPSVLLLDEPTSQLDPIAAQDFLKMLEKINRELGTTVILSEHRLEDAFPLADRVLVLEDGLLLANDTPRAVGATLAEAKHPLYAALPAALKICRAIENRSDIPLTVREGKNWLTKFAEKGGLAPELIPQAAPRTAAEPMLEMQDVWFRYDKNLPDVIKGLNLTVRRGELFALVGGNGTGKTTALSVLSGLRRPYRGKVLLGGKPLQNISNLYSGLLGALPQNPQSLFIKKTVEQDLAEALAETGLTEDEKQEAVWRVAALCRLEPLLQSHPYDLSGGEQQRAALAKVLLREPQILLLDEPTKGMDAAFKQEFAAILSRLKAEGVTVVMVSHDVEFCAAHADRCAMFFDGSITSEEEPRAFFAGKAFYTTAANRMARYLLPKAVLCDDVIAACGGAVPTMRNEADRSEPIYHQKTPKFGNNEPERKKKKRKPPVKTMVGGLCALFFICLRILLLCDLPWMQFAYASMTGYIITQSIGIVSLAAAFFCFFSPRAGAVQNVRLPKGERRLTKRTLFALLFILSVVPLTIYIGVRCFGQRKYYLISLLIMFETLLPFCMMFEHRKPQARELVVVSVLCALAVSGRAAFSMLPQFKPVAALVIIGGVCFGGETGFLTGAVTAFVSNFFFGQGPWTPWQMFAFGLIGLLAGILFQKGMISKTKGSLSAFGFLVTFIIYGGIMNPASVIMWQNSINGAMLLSAYAMGLPFDLIHAFSTAFFLWFIAEPMIEKLERIKIKYGLITR